MISWNESGSRVGLLSIATGVPPYELHQAEACAFAKEFFAADFDDPGKFEALLGTFTNAGVQRRRLAVPVDWLLEPRSFAEKNAVYVKAATELSRDVAERAIAAVGLSRAEVGGVVFASSTGIATPSLDARLVQELGLARSVQRMPLWGLGCAGGGAALLRALILARGLGQPVLAIACELCSLTFVYQDRRKANVVAAALFGDGAAAAVIAPEPWWSPSQGPELMRGHSQLLDRSEHLMGWDVEEGGLRVRFDPTIPSVVREHLAPVVEEACKQAGLEGAAEVEHWVVHPGGPKVLEAYQAALSVPSEALRHARTVLRDHGNMSSPTVLFAFERFLVEVPPSGRAGLVLGLGPGFCIEGAVFRW